jgi:ATP-dependent DNA helicase RecG
MICPITNFPATSWWARGKLLQNLAALRSNGNIQPLPAIAVAKFEFPDGDVAVVEVRPSDLPPVRYKGRVYVHLRRR